MEVQTDRVALTMYHQFNTINAAASSKSPFVHGVGQDAAINPHLVKPAAHYIHGIFSGSNLLTRPAFPSFVRYHVTAKEDHASSSLSFPKTEGTFVAIFGFLLMLPTGALEGVILEKPNFNVRR